VATLTDEERLTGIVRLFIKHFSDEDRAVRAMFADGPTRGLLLMASALVEAASAVADAQAHRESMAEAIRTTCVRGPLLKLRAENGTAVSQLVAAWSRNAEEADR
jgi:hypothetical protein